MLATGDGGGVAAGTVLSVRILRAKFKYSKKICGLRPQYKRVPLPLKGRFAAEGHSIQCLSGSDRRGGRCM